MKSSRKPIKTSNQSSAQVVSWVMNDDCLTLVFNQIDPKSLFRLQRVSKQLNDCILE